MSFSIFGKKRYLGVDIGTSSIKVVQLHGEKKRAHLDTYGYVDYESNLVYSDDPDVVSKTAVVLRKVLDAARVQTRRAVVSLPGFTVFSSVIELPAMTKKEMDSAVRFEARKIVPSPLEEVVLDWTEIESFITREGRVEKDGAQKKTTRKQIFITAVPKRLVKKYIKAMKIVGLNIIAIESEFFPMTRALIGSDLRPTMIVDMGALATNFNIVDQGYLRLNHGIDTGGDAITRAIMSSMEVDEARANQFKIQYGVDQSRGESQISSVIVSIIDSTANEIKRLRQVYFRKYNRRIERIILIGGTAHLPGLVEHWKNQFGIPVQVGNPWSHVICHPQAKPYIDKIAPRFAVAVGSALREIVEE